MKKRLVKKLLKLYNFSYEQEDIDSFTHLTTRGEVIKDIQWYINLEEELFTMIKDAERIDLYG